MSNVNIDFHLDLMELQLQIGFTLIQVKLKIVLSFDACDFSSVSGRIITLTLLNVGNTLDNQNAKRCKYLDWSCI